MSLKLGMKHQAMELYKVCINYDPGMTLTFFTARSTYAAHAFEWEKIGKCQLMAKNLLGMRKWTEYSCNIFGPEGCLPLPRGFIHVYDHNVLTSSSLKPLGQSKPNFMRSILRKSKCKFVKLVKVT